MQAKEFKIHARTLKFASTKITNSTDAVDYIRNIYKDDIDIYETAYIVMTNRSGMSIGHAKISQGGIAATPVDVIMVAKYAIDCLASQVIFIHNHPSGNLNPSKQDKDITKRLQNALKLLDVRLTDSIIITNESYYSFSDNGELL